jgi:hypothetical protein
LQGIGGKWEICSLFTDNGGCLTSSKKEKAWQKSEKSTSCAFWLKKLSNFGLFGKLFKFPEKLEHFDTVFYK